MDLFDVCLNRKHFNCLKYNTFSLLRVIYMATPSIEGIDVYRIRCDGWPEKLRIISDCTNDEYLHAQYD